MSEAPIGRSIIAKCKPGPNPIQSYAIFEVVGQQLGHGEKIFWSRNNGGSGWFTVGCEPVGWIPIPDD